MPVQVDSTTKKVLVDSTTKKVLRCCNCPDPDAETITLIVEGVSSCGVVVGCIIPGILPNGTWTLTRIGPGDWAGALDGNFEAEVSCVSRLTVFIADSAIACDYFVGETIAPGLGPVSNEITECGGDGSGIAAFGGTARITT